MPHQTTIECPNCKKKGVIRVPPDKHGPLKIKCPNCSHRFTHRVELRAYYRRTPFPVVHYGYFDLDFKNLPWKGELADISSTGCRVHTYEQPPRKDEELSLRFRLPRDDLELSIDDEAVTMETAGETEGSSWEWDIRVGGKVVWVREEGVNFYSFGVRFTYVDDYMKKSIGFYLFPYHEPIK